MQVMLMRLMSKGEYLIVPKGTKFKGSGKLGLRMLLLNSNCETKGKVIKKLTRKDCEPYFSYGHQMIGIGQEGIVVIKD